MIATGTGERQRWPAGVMTCRVARGPRRLLTHRSEEGAAISRCVRRREGLAVSVSRLTGPAGVRLRRSAFACSMAKAREAGLVMMVCRLRRRPSMPCAATSSGCIALPGCLYALRGWATPLPGVEASITTTLPEIQREEERPVRLGSVDVGDVEVERAVLCRRRARAGQRSWSRVPPRCGCRRRPGGGCRAWRSARRSIGSRRRRHRRSAQGGQDEVDDLLRPFGAAATSGQVFGEV